MQLPCLFPKLTTHRPLMIIAGFILCHIVLSKTLKRLARVSLTSPTPARRITPLFKRFLASDPIV